MTFKTSITLALGLLTAAVMSAAPVSCGAPPPTSQTVATFQTTGPSGFSLTCAGLTFSNFEVVDAGSTLPATMNLVSAFHDSALNMVVLNFNPNLYASAGTVQDLHFYFQVNGGVSGIDLAVGGTNSSITERACAAPINRLQASNCTGGWSNQLAALTNLSGNSSVTSTFAEASSVHIFKDILVDGRLSATGAELTSFSQSFDTSETPEPLSILLMGSGLMGLVVLRRRINA